VAARDAVNILLANKTLTQDPIKDNVAAISVGIYNGTPVLDLDYAEDSACDTDMNVVMTGNNGIIEVQGTAEGAAFSRDELNALLNLAESGIRQLVQEQQAALK
jgi:ribonuclease PH